MNQPLKRKSTLRQPMIFFEKNLQEGNLRALFQKKGKDVNNFLIQIYLKPLEIKYYQLL